MEKDDIKIHYIISQETEIESIDKVRLAVSDFLDNYDLIFKKCSPKRILINGPFACIGRIPIRPEMGCEIEKLQILGFPEGAVRESRSDGVDIEFKDNIFAIEYKPNPEKYV